MYAIRSYYGVAMDHAGHGVPAEGLGDRARGDVHDLLRRRALRLLALRPVLLREQAPRSERLGEKFSYNFV